MRRRSFDEAFKADAVRLATGSAKSAAQVARELEISPPTLNNWIRERKMRAGDKPLPPPSDSETTTESESDELRRLRRENKRLNQEVDFLKKATAYFAKNHE